MSGTIRPKIAHISRKLMSCPGRRVLIPEDAARVLPGD